MSKLVKGSYEEWKYNLPGSQRNKIVQMVNCQVPKNEAGLKGDFESRFYDEIWGYAEEHQKKYGFWPTYEMAEIEWEDPKLDIYRDKE